MPYLNETKELKGDILDMKPTPTGKGWILSTEKFDAFLWSRNKVLTNLIQAVSTWIEGGVGFQLEIIRKSIEDKDFEVRIKTKGKDRIPVTWYHTNEGYSCRPKDPNEEVNPFLI